jgi:phosphohistidine phosphatase
VDDGAAVQLVVSSPALRAITTAREYAAAFGAGLVERPELYAASARTILAVAAALPEEASVAMLVGHNPGMSDAVAELTGEFVELPTCAIVTCAVDVGSWAELIEGSGRLELVRTPRD